MQSLRITLVILLAGLLSLSATAAEDGSLSKAYKSELSKWKNERRKGLLKNDGWLSLTGLFWLEKGMNTVGSAKDNKVILPKGHSPEYLGNLFLVDDKVIANFPPGSLVTDETNVLVYKKELRTDQQEKTTILSHGPLLFYVIERNGKFAVRVKNKLLPKKTGLDELTYFPEKKDWIVKGTFTPYEGGKKIAVPNILDFQTETASPGKVEFTYQGKQYSLDTMDAGEELFIVFGDKTNGKDTYGAGRFIYISKPAEGSNTVSLDFNRAYNPPCVFSKYATCPLPPPQNKLKLAVTAGEKSYHH